MRRLHILVVLLVACCSGELRAQSTNASVTGYITDPTKAVIVGAKVIVINVSTNIRYEAATNGVGSYDVPNVPPGPYRIEVEKPGFKTVVKSDLILHVQDTAAINFELALGSASEIVTVRAGSLVINTTDASVSTVIDQKFVERLPLNGRGFNALLQLTPGVVIAPLSAGGVGASGQFSIAGQREDANNFMVDGVSVNFGVSGSTSPQQSGSGSAQAFSVLGGTSSLVSVEALQEFRIETSSFAPEFGRSPGGQVILTTRAGSNDFHGGLYEYFRNDVLDANDWFANALGKPRSPERHNDFGGYLGGPIVRDKSFFFVSYEGARLRIPQAALKAVPSMWARNVAAPPALAPFLNAFPQPDDKTITPGVYTSPLTGSWSNAATLNAGSVRIDHSFGSRFSVFGRYNEAPSQLVSRVFALSTTEPQTVNTRTATVGLNAFLSPRLSNVFRFNYSKQSNEIGLSVDSFGGAVPPPATLLIGTLPPQQTQASVGFSDVGSYYLGPNARNVTTQFNTGDDLSFSLGAHLMKYGVDYRVIDLQSVPALNQIGYFAPTVQKFLTSNGQASVLAVSTAKARVRFQALSLYAQDSWKASPRLTVTYGLRWELSPAPEALGSTILASWNNIDNPSLLALAPPGTPVWHTTYGNFAPRAGIAYALTDKGDLVLRAGGGIFYDLGVGSSVVGFFPNSASNFVPGQQVPLADPAPLLPTLSLLPPYPDGVYGFSQNHKLPRSYQWNLALEKSFGAKQSVSATYVGQAGRDLLRQAALFMPNPNFQGDFLVSTNESRSNYNALQLQYRRPLSARLQAILNYTWSHSLDNASNDVIAGLSNAVISATNDYASSDFDIRHSFSGAITYDVPSVAKSGPLARVTRDWSVDAIIVARSGFPFNAKNFLSPSPDPSGFALTRPDLVSGQPLWFPTPNAPGGKVLNPNAFVAPATVRQGTEGRNDIPGFGLTQIDLSVARSFSISERVRLQFRADAFNALNHPNFTNPFGYVVPGDTEFLQSSQMLNVGLGGSIRSFSRADRVLCNFHSSSHSRILGRSGRGA